MLSNGNSFAAIESGLREAPIMRWLSADTRWRK
jgi:hypothetical protein